MNKLQMAEQFRKVLQMFAASLDEETAMEVAAVFPDWEPGRSYKVGDYVAYGVNSVGDPQLYKVAQAHTSQSDWAPGAAASLFSSIGLNKEGFPTWSQPTGAHDAYDFGDIVDYGGELYKSLVSGNVWAPGTAADLWEVHIK